MERIREKFLFGHSGCPIRIFQEGNQRLFIKESANQKYNERLVKQIEKQKRFKYPRSYISSVPVLNYFYDKNDIYTVIMPYVDHYNFYMVLCEEPPSKLNLILERIIEYFTYGFQAKTPKVPGAAVLTSKLDSLERQIPCSESDAKISEIIKKTRLLLESDPSCFDFPQGDCHGDFTLDNMLFSRKDCDIVLIDFLDSFVESPLIDVVKFRQDTKYHWYIYKNEMHYLDFKKVEIALAHFDRSIDRYLSNLPADPKLFLLLELFNYLRILPYVQSNFMRDYIIKILAGLSRKVGYKGELLADPFSIGRQTL